MAKAGQIELLFPRPKGQGKKQHDYFAPGLSPVNKK